ncbi:MAG: LpxL/LpxP family Kdo(2)-lipid IV(A) lauroyl/palmitoleoyl acyltransferase [Steroidobacteraceae bacterium]|jgi:KDO2-lipid IV(A) lauroyltransferase|nr:LpxL/LpxP family Kdo(2)-lipid IV(A) lauroyl/palmitoleoyl acyltransferase [Steroidobacteraceae bacterium]
MNAPPRRKPRAAPPPRLLLPQHWPTWLAAGLLWLLAKLPYPTMLKVGGALGALAYRLPLPQRRVARRNLALCLPELPEAQRERILRAHFRSVGITLCETALIWYGPTAKVLSLVHFDGLEHVDRLRAQGRGVILLAAHFTTLEISAGMFTLTRDAYAVYKPSKNALVTWLFETRRGAVSEGMISRDDIRAMIRVLKAGGIVWYSPDQAFRGKGAEMVPFFGLPVATNTATSRLAKLTGAAVLPYFSERLPGDAGYRVSIGAPFDDFPSADAVADTLRFHRLIETQVRRVPEQYLWLHKRFKGLSADYPDFYDGRPVGREAALAATAGADGPSARPADRATADDARHST